MQKRQNFDNPVSFDHCGQICASRGRFSPRPPTFNFLPPHMGERASGVLFRRAKLEELMI